MTRKWWTINAFVWAFCAVGWFWIAYIINYAPGLLVSFLCGALTVASVYLAERSAT